MKEMGGGKGEETGLAGWGEVVDKGRLGKEGKGGGYRGGDTCGGEGGSCRGPEGRVDRGRGGNGIS